MSEVGSFAVVDVMRTEIFTLTPETPVGAARRMAKEKRIDHLLVLDGGTLAGIICQHDLNSGDKEALVGDCMSTPVLCVAPDTSVDDAAAIMLEHDVSCLPVVMGTSLIGIITRETLEGMGCMRLAHPDDDLSGWWDFDDAKSPSTCAACGLHEDVYAEPKLHDLPLCGACIVRATSSGDGCMGAN